MKTKGFTLIEILVALVILAIGLTALLKASAEQLFINQRIKNKLVSHWVAMQAVTLVQTGLIKVNQGEESTRLTKALDESWYWRLKISPSPVKGVEQLTLRLSQKEEGPFRHAIIAYRMVHEEN